MKNVHPHPPALATHTTGGAGAKLSSLNAKNVRLWISLNRFPLWTNVLSLHFVVVTQEMGPDGVTAGAVLSGVGNFLAIFAGSFSIGECGRVAWCALRCALDWRFVLEQHPMFW
mgnify:CR=1 FL=1